MREPADPTALAGGAGERRNSRPRAAGGARNRPGAGWRPRAAPEAPSRWALALFWASAAFTGFALALLISSFFG